MIVDVLVVVILLNVLVVEAVDMLVFKNSVHTLTYILKGFLMYHYTVHPVIHMVCSYIPANS
jgi:hypothetical protein